MTSYAISPFNSRHHFHFSGFNRGYRSIMIQLLYDPDALIRGHASWALWRTMGRDSSKLLTDLYHREEDQQVRDEIEFLLQ